MDRKMVAERRRDATVVVGVKRGGVLSCLPQSPTCRRLYRMTMTFVLENDNSFQSARFGLLRAVVVYRTDADASTDDDKEEDDDDDDANIL